jgi:hypothetical protein
MKQQTKHSEQQQTEVGQESQQRATMEFANAEDLLRYDAAQVSVPPGIGQRLKESLGDLPPPPPRSWWRKLLGG